MDTGRVYRLDDAGQSNLTRDMAAKVTILLGRKAEDGYASKMVTLDGPVVIAKLPASLSKLPERMDECKIICPYPTNDIVIGIDVTLADQQSCRLWRQCFDVNLMAECEGKVAKLPSLDVMGLHPTQSFYIVAGWMQGATREDVLQFAIGLVEACWRDR
jgi:hypothetical protein